MIWPRRKPNDNWWSRTWKDIVRSGYVAVPIIVVIVVGLRAGWWG